MWWKHLPPGSEGIGVGELALLALDAMRASSFERSLHFETSDDYVSAAFESVLGTRELATLHFRDFYFESRAAHVSLHGRWVLGEPERAGDSYGAVYRHDMQKVKTA